MIFDVHTAVGHWPFRRLPLESAGGLRKHLTAKGISGAAAVHTHGLFYKNCHDANIELHECLEGHRDFFTGVATLNPRYTAWERDLRTCVEEFGFRGVRLTPLYHDYDLTDERAVALARAAASLQVPVFFPQRIVDVRQRHWRDVDAVLSLEAIGAFSLAAGKAKIIVTEGAVSAETAVNEKNEPRWPGLYFEISRMRSAYGQVLAGLARALGGDRLLFGSGAPFKETAPALLKLQGAALEEKERRRIASENARELLLSCTG